MAAVKPVGGYDRTQARLVVGVGLALVLLNVLLTVGQPLEKSLPRSVRVAQERENFGAAKPMGNAREPVAAAAAAPSGWFGGGASGTRGGAASGPKSTTPLKKKAAKPSPSAKPDWSTHEHCYAQSDESEVCFYHGPLCYDGDKLIVASDHNHGQDVRTSMCYDFRHFVASPSCGYSGPHRRDNLPDDTDMQTMQDRVPRMLSYHSERKWGPMGREIHYREIGTDLFEDKEMQEAENVTFKWLDGPMYVGGLHHSWLDHTWHFSAAAMALFDLKRYNRSAHVDTGMHGAASGSLTPVGAWEAPPMDNLLIAGDYRNVHGLSELRPWIAHLLTMLVQNHTNILWNSIWKEQWKTSKQQWLCSKQSVVIGLKPRLFNSIGDAHVWRMLAYKYVGVKAPTKDEWPPRRITVITRIGTRNVVNIDEAVDLIRSYGLEVNWIKEMGLLTFQEQVKAMAESGILLAVHGAGLANVMFMPAHSVVIELTPYIMYASMYRDLAAAAGLYYYRLPSDKPSNETYGSFHDQDFFDKCDGDVKHISSPAAFLDYECNSRSKGSPVLINMAKLQATLELALDDIGCRDGFCHEGGADMPGWGYQNLKKRYQNATKK